LRRRGGASDFLPIPRRRKDTIGQQRQQEIPRAVSSLPGGRQKLLDLGIGQKVLRVPSAKWNRRIFMEARRLFAEKTQPIGSVTEVL
jgi:hypothetical protein